jgi:hypothetical protein
LIDCSIYCRIRKIRNMLKQEIWKKKKL